MKYNQLGRTGLFVSELCLGTMTLGGNADAGMWSSIGAVAQKEANQLIAQALSAGINFIDTADIYSFGQSERITGVAIKELGVVRSDIILATKTGGVMGSGPNDKGASRGHIMDSVQRSLERLQVDYIDLFQIHASDPITPIEDFPPVDRDLAWRCVAEMRVIADKYAVSVSRIALAWLLARPWVTSVIIGVKRVTQLTDNLGATDITLTAEELTHLDAISAMSPHYPGWMIEHQDAERYPNPFTFKTQS
ncbi:aldo/keto reductase [Yokenella regensburgei]|uniref:aldo/keto reductase n=1 Tax=Yokenella regensburgei TaxID=158877 RepID=UPI003F14EA27